VRSMPINDDWAYNRSQSKQSRPSTTHERFQF
jgi:hypothetical protein